MLLMIQIIFIGIFATLFMDVIAYIREKLFQIRSLNYAFLGRWILLWKDGTLTHENITLVPVVKFERVIGWFIHYLIGIFWVYVYLVLDHLLNFNSLFLSSISFSLLTTLISFLILQPALGFGFFALKTPNPLISIKNSLLAHLFFGIGLYLSYMWIRPMF
ncbi:DUF2938 family protein [Acinetobacter shaoyimingii]|uniref:DUF2938 domain-containing protein n=1 Tax=Acinetobacter shaoyimingii TaxID=2715164 RepID=A0A6G8RRB9_9GAMM|nr:DUF2938 family protein [Acinetobacter shaoyimingii]QIO04466.1 DUF2938 domain-containing protein [Acinetobacter shaoyimingii]